jgi:mono/diheme cytochrome c family protein
MRPQHKSFRAAPRTGTAVRIWAAALLIGLAPAGARAEGDAAAGRKLATAQCSRCHVVSEENRMGGIGSTPSFKLLTSLDDYLDRFQTFFERRPHPAFITVGDTPRWTKLPANAAEISLTHQDVENIVAFVKTLKTE